MTATTDVRCENSLVPNQHTGRKGRASAQDTVAVHTGSGAALDTGAGVVPGSSQAERRAVGPVARLHCFARRLGCSECFAVVATRCMLEQGSKQRRLLDDFITAMSLLFMNGRGRRILTDRNCDGNASPCRETVTHPTISKK